MAIYIWPRSRDAVTISSNTILSLYVQPNRPTQPSLPESHHVFLHGPMFLNPLTLIRNPGLALVSIVKSDVAFVPKVEPSSHTRLH